MPGEVTCFSPRQRQVLTWWRQRDGCDALICDGAVRSGKTFSMGLSFFLWAQTSFRGQQFGLCGKTISSLRRNLLTDLLPYLRRQGFRILESYRRLPNGANAAWYEQTAMGHSGVAAARAIGRARGVGTVDVYIAAQGGLPDDALLEEVRADLQQRREIAVDVAVLAPETVSVDVTAEIAAADFETARISAETAVRAYFTGERLGCAVLAAELGRDILAADGVENVHLLAPAADISAADGVLPVLGTLTITEV